MGKVMDFDARAFNDEQIIAKYSKEKAYDEIETLFLNLLENKDDHHIKLSEIYYAINKNLFACYAEDKIMKFYYQDPTSGRFLDDSSKKIFHDGIKKIIAVVDRIIIEKQKIFGFSADKVKVGSDIDKLIKIRNKFGTDGTMNSIYKIVGGYYLIDKFEELLDSKTNLIGFDNGVYDLDTGIFRKAEYNEYVSKTCKYSFPEFDESKAKRVKETIRNMFKNEEDYNAMMFQLAYFLTGNKKFETIHIWTGVGGNGKSILMNFIRSAFGQYFEQLSASYFTNPDHRSNEASPELVRLKGVRVVNTDEMGANSKLLIAKMKRLTTNIQGRNLFKSKQVEFIPQFGNIIQANDMPLLSDVDHAIDRRLKINRFPFTFKTKENIERDFANREIPENIKVSDINLLKDIEGFELYKQFMLILIDEYQKKVKGAGSFYESQSMIDERTEFLNSCNPVKVWFDNNYEITNDSKDKISSSKVFNHFKRSSSNVIMASDQFIRYMSDLGIQQPKKSDGIMVFRNIKERILNNDEDNK